MEEIKEGEAVVRLYSKLSGYLDFNDGRDDQSLSAYELRRYQKKIEKKLEKDFIRKEETGLACYVEHPDLKDKLISMQPFVENWDEMLWGVLEIKSSETLSEQEFIYLQGEWRGQLTDGWGEGFAQREIKVGHRKSLYVDFCAGALIPQLYLEQELKEDRLLQSDGKEACKFSEIKMNL